MENVGQSMALKLLSRYSKINKSNMIYEKSYDEVWKFHGNTSKKTGSSKLSLNIYIKLKPDRATREAVLKSKIK